MYKRGPDGQPLADELLDETFGGIYDSLSLSVVGPLPHGAWPEVSIHEGQLPLFRAIGSKARRVLGLGSPGGGKSLGIAKVGQCLAAERPNSLGGFVAPTRDRLDILWTKFLALVEPIGWVKEIRNGDMEILLWNGTLCQFKAAKKQSAATGSPIAGKDWHWCVEDEQQHISDDDLREVDARGRINKFYQVFSSATNEPLHEFQMRVQEYEANPEKKVIRFRGLENCWTPLEHWEALKRNWSADDYARIIDCLDVPREGRVYPQFTYAECTAPIPASTTDVTEWITEQAFRQAFKYVVGFDPGVICTASVILKAYGTRQERKWFVLDEVTTRDASTEWHALDLKKWFDARGISLDDVLVLGDPHVNKEADRSDFISMKAGGFASARPSNGGNQISRRHRLSMVNALLRDAAKRRRLFLAASESGPAKAYKTAESLGHLMYTATGDIDTKHKTAANIAHWSDALGIGLYPFEKMRGAYGTKVIQG